MEFKDCDVPSKDWDVFQVSKLDLLKINALVNSAYRGESSKVGWTTEADLLGGQRVDYDLLAEILDRPHSGILALKQKNGEICGCVHLQVEESDTSKVCWLGMLTVKPGMQNRGLGKILLRASEDWAKTWGCAKIKMNVISIRQSLIDWYIRHGFNDTGLTRPFPYGDPRFGLPKREDLTFKVLEKSI